jgi:hypothetical protein
MNEGGIRKFRTPPSWCSLASEQPEVTPTLSIKLHREAFMKVVDPETTLTNEMLRPRREGSAVLPQARHERQSFRCTLATSCESLLLSCSRRSVVNTG